MKKLIGILSLLLAILMLAVCLSACNAGGAQQGNEQETTLKKETLKIEEIDWSVDEGIVDGERFILLNYTNNSKHTIVEFEMQFKQKPDITEEEKSAYFHDLKVRFDIDENDPDDAQDFEELKKREISMHAESEKVTRSGETATAINCKYYDGYYNVNKATHYALVVPDIAMVKYIDDSYVYTLYYDFSSKKYSKSSDTEIAYYWTDKGLETVVPKPESDYVKENGRDDKDCFMFEACGWGKEQFNVYVKSCKEMGFTINAKEYEGYYSADNASGYNVYLHYDKEDYSMQGTIKVTSQETE